MGDPFIYFDETGQTYYNYLDAAQTHLAYGGLKTSEDEAAELKRKHFGRVQAEELHYVQLRKNGVGQVAVKSFLSQERPWIEANFKWYLADKRYALLAKYVDLLIEPEVADLGDNLYSGGGAQQLVFLLHHTARREGHEESLSRLMTAFSAYARQPDEELLTELEKVAGATSVGDERLDILLRMPFARSGKRLLESAVPAHLDLSFAAAWTLADLWYQALERPFFLIHDESRTMSSQIGAWRNMTREDIGYEADEIGPFKIPTNIPLKETIFVSSKTCVPLQLVDVLVGMSRALLEWSLRGRPEDAFLSELEALIPIPVPAWSILPIHNPFDLPKDDQTVEEINAVLGKIARRKDGRSL